jgi:hypothetical protein
MRTGKERRNVIPPSGVGSAAVDEHQGRQFDVAPRAQMNATAIDFDFGMVWLLV